LFEKNEKFEHHLFSLKEHFSLTVYEHFQPIIPHRNIQVSCKSSIKGDYRNISAFNLFGFFIQIFDVAQLLLNLNVL